MSKKKHKEKQKSNDEITIDIENIKEKSLETIKKAEKISKNKYVKYGWIALLIIIIIIISSYVRLGPQSLPITDNWAQNMVENNYKNMIAQQIQQEKPNLPESSIRRMTDEDYKEFYKENKAQIDSQIQQVSQQYKDMLQNEKGMTYLLGIDEYFFYSHAKWYQKEGHFGTDIVDGEERFMLRNGRFGFPARFMMHPFLINVLHDAWKPFNQDFDIEWASFYIQVILIGLASIPLFFLNKKISGTTGGFIATILVLTAIPLVGRTMGGSSDDDAHTILWTFIMMALLFNALDKKTSTIAIMAGLAGLVNAFFMISWSGWWYGYLLVLGSAGLYIVYEFVRKKIEKKTLTKQDWIRNSAFLVIFFVSAIIFSMMISPLTNNTAGEMASSVITAPAQPMKLVLSLGAGADIRSAGGDYPLWPNVLRTVEELNKASFKQIIQGAGTLGNTGILLFYLSILGIISLFLRYKENSKYLFYGLVLLAWATGMIFVAHSAVRFVLMASIPILLGVGPLIGYITGPLAEKIKKNTTIRKSIYVSVVSITLTIILLWAPVSNARTMSENAIPIFDDAWYESVYAIKDDASQYEQRGIISSWWDYGHFFQAYGEQTVTFDGADQGKRIYWMGRSLLTSDVDEAHDILKVMNCGQEKPYNLLEEYIGERYKATNIKLEITRMTKEEARTYLMNYLNEEQTQEILELTHCEDLYPMYFVTSEDMVGKAPVWSHFGGWNFTRAYFYYYLRNLPLTDVYTLTEENLGMNQEQTRTLYNEAKLIRNEDQASQWISPYLNYLTRQKTTCTEANNTVTCNFELGLQQDATSTVVLRRAIIPLNNLEETQLIVQAINRATGTPMGQDIIKPNKIIIENNGAFQEHGFEQGTGFDLVLMKEETRHTALLTSPELSTSVFTRLFFMEGRGEDLSMFEKISDVTSFRGERIIVWKVSP
ncbi:hypothetical protein KO361_02725 [Candidatus Woesearchaeota archaeon]|nr:hypothetical protein [Candidatus Woesearchaeota archaeon]